MKNINGIKFYPIPKFKNYFISKQGSIWSKSANTLLKPQIKYRNYTYHRLSPGGGNPTKNMSTHRLVMLTFFGPSDLDVNHKDGNPLNNRLSNLEYCTKSQNQRHSFRKGFRKNKKGLDNPQSIITKEILDELRYSKLCNVAFAKKHGVSPNTIGRWRRNYNYKRVIG